MRYTPTFFFGVAVVVLLIACTKKEEDAAAPEPDLTNGNAYTMTIDSPVGMYFMLDGQELILDSNAWSAAASAYPQPSSGYPYAICAFVFGANQVWSWTIGLTSLADPLPVSDVLALCSTGPRAFTLDPATQAGVYFQHRTAGTIEWNTACGTGNQSGSLFEIEDMRFVDDSTDTIQVLARFACILYDCTTDSTRTISNGRLRWDLPIP